jgi:excisionase family DNA binding protein
MPPSSNLLTTRQYADLAGVSTATISKWIRSGKLKAEKIGNKWMLPAGQLEQKKAAAPQASSPPLKASQTPSGSGPIGNTSYTVAEFSAMTYLTEFGVTQWLKQGRLAGTRDETGQWRVEAANLEKSDVQRLLRK